VKHASRRSLQARQKPAVSVQAERNEQKQEGIYYARALHCAHGRKAIHCITLPRHAWLYGQKTASNSHPAAADNPARMHQQSSCNCIQAALHSASHDGLAFGHKLPWLQHEHSSHMQHAYHTSSQEPDNPLGMSSSSSINSPLAIVCECTSRSCSASSSKCTPPAKPQF